MDSSRGLGRKCPLDLRFALKPFQTVHSCQYGNNFCNNKNKVDSRIKTKAKLKGGQTDEGWTGDGRVGTAGKYCKS